MFEIPACGAGRSVDQLFAVRCASASRPIAYVHMCAFLSLSRYTSFAFFRTNRQARHRGKASDKTGNEPFRGPANQTDIAGINRPSLSTA